MKARILVQIRQNRLYLVNANIYLPLKSAVKHFRRMDPRVPCLLLLLSSLSERPDPDNWLLLTTLSLHHFPPRPAMQSATHASNLCSPPICPLRFEGLLKNAGLLRDSCMVSYSALLLPQLKCKSLKQNNAPLQFPFQEGDDKTHVKHYNLWLAFDCRTF